MDVAEVLIKKYYLPNNIDLYDTLVETKKGMKFYEREKMEELVKLLPTDSVFLST